MSAGYTHIVGLGITGLSCLRHLHGRVPVRVFDTRNEPPYLAAVAAEFPDVEVVCGDIDPERLADAARIVVSPGIALDSCLLRPATVRRVPFESDIGLFLKAVSGPVIGITGTNGKSTVTALAGALLEAVGGRPGIGGNIGRPALDLVGKPYDRYVVELSSFQLDRFNSETLDIGVLLNVTPDHLDRYPDFRAYGASKQRVFEGARVAIYNRQDPGTRPTQAVEQQVSVGLDTAEAGAWGLVEHAGTQHLCHGADPLMSVDALRMRGRHNYFNALAALAIVSAAGFDPRDCLDALAEFSGLDHRCQTILEAGGITYINDSKATNPGAAAAALEGLGKASPHILLIAGGDSKGAALDELVVAARGRVKTAFVLGQDRDRVGSALAEVTTVKHVDDLSEAVRGAHQGATPGDVVLLSPACSSLDMFDSFEARGTEFVAAVHRESGRMNRESGR